MKKIIAYVFLTFGLFLFSACRINKNPDVIKNQKYEITYHYKDNDFKDKEDKIQYSKDQIVNKPEKEFTNDIKSHRLVGWKYNEEIFEFGKTISQNIDLYAIYEKKKFEVKTLVDGVENIKSVEYDTPLYKVGLTEPKKDYHEFVGWYKDGNKVDRNFSITDNLELVAKFKPIDIPVEISFEKDSNGDDIWEIVKVPYGSTISKANLTHNNIYYGKGIENPQNKSQKLVGFLNDNFPFDVLNEKITSEGNKIKPEWGERKLRYTLNLPDKKITELTDYNGGILHSINDFPLYENKYFDGVYTKGNNKIDSNYKLLKDNEEFDVRYHDGLPSSAYNYFLDDNNNHVISGIKNDYFGEFTIPDEINGKKVTKIASGAFANFTRIKKVKFNKYITEIPDTLFYNCKSLEEIDVDYSKITYIGNQAFSGCISLKEFKFDDSKITKIGYSAFEDCTSLKKAIFPSTLKKIGKAAFRNCENLEEIILRQVEEIGDSSFENCFKLKLVEIPSTLRIISESAFRNNKSLDRVIFPNNLLKILSYAFKDCPKLETYTIPESLDELGHEMFDKNDDVKVLNLPNVRRLDSRSFANFKNLEEVKINTLLSLRVDAFLNAPKFRKITVKEYKLEGEHHYLSDFGVSVNILEKLSSEAYDHHWKEFVMKKEAIIDLPDKKLRLNDFQVKKIVMSDDVKTSNIKFYDDSLEYVYIGKNFDDKEAAYSILESIRPYQGQVVEFSSENKIIKEYKGFYYVNRSTKPDFLENPEYWLVGAKDSSQTTLDLIDGFYESELHMYSNGLFKDGIPKIEKIIVNNITTNKILWHRFVRYEYLKYVELNKNSTNKYTMKNGCVYNKNESICYFSPVALEMDEFIIPKNQPADEALFIQNKNIKTFKIEDNQNGPIWFVNSAKKYVYRKAYGRMNLERYFGDDEEFVIDNSDPIDALTGNAFSGNNLRLRRVVLDKDRFKGHQNLYLYRETEVEFRRNLETTLYVQKDKKYKNDKMTLIISGTTTKFTQRFECELETIIGSEKLVEIGEAAFARQKLIEEFDFESTEKIGQLAFKESGLKSLKNLRKSAHVESSAFAECQNLKEAYFGEDYVENAYTHCKNIEKIVIDKTEADLQMSSFSNKISHVEITDKVTKLNWMWNFPSDEVDKHKQNNNLQTELVLSKNLKKIQGIEMLFPHLKKLTIQSPDFDFGYANEQNGFENLEEVVFGKDVSFQDDYGLPGFFSVLKKLTKVEVHPDNHNFNIVNDCLLNSDGTMLIRCISQGDTIDVPDTVNYILDYFANTAPNAKKMVIGKNIQKILNMPKSITEVTLKSNDLEIDNLVDRGIEVINIGNEINENKVIEITTRFKKVKRIKLLDGNTFVNQKDEVFYSKDNKRLIAYPAYLKKKEFKVPRHVEEITALFNENNYLERLYIPKELDIFSGNVNHCYRLTIIVEKGAKFQKKSNMNIFNPTYQFIIWDAIFDY